MLFERSLFISLTESISSLSGSESSEEEENSKLSPRAQRRHHTAHKNLLFFSTQDNHVYGVHPVILYHPKVSPHSSSLHIAVRIKDSGGTEQESPIPET